MLTSNTADITVKHQQKYHNFNNNVRIFQLSASWTKSHPCLCQKNKKTLHCGRRQRAYVSRAAVSGHEFVLAAAFLIKSQTQLVYMPGQSWRRLFKCSPWPESVAVDMHLDEAPYDPGLERTGAL